MQLTFQQGADVLVLQAEPDGDGWRVRLPDGSEHHITARRLPGDVMEIAEGARVFRVPFAVTARGLELSRAGEAFAFATPSNRKTTSNRKHNSGALIAPMSGIVVEVKVTAGQTVEAAQPLVVVEAMKVYATVEAPFAGRVRAVHVQPGQRIEQGALLVDIQPETEAGP